MQIAGLVWEKWLQSANECATRGASGWDVAGEAHYEVEYANVKNA